MVKRTDEETGKEYTCCLDEEYKQWADDCGGRYCTLLKLSWNEWAYQDYCDSCQSACESDF